MDPNRLGDLSEILFELVTEEELTAGKSYKHQTFRRAVRRVDDQDLAPGWARCYGGWVYRAEFDKAA